MERLAAKALDRIMFIAGFVTFHAFIIMIFLGYFMKEAPGLLNVIFIGTIVVDIICCFMMSNIINTTAKIRQANMNMITE